MLRRILLANPSGHRSYHPVTKAKRELVRTVGSPSVLINTYPYHARVALFINNKPATEAKHLDSTPVRVAAQGLRGCARSASGSVWNGLCPYFSR
jgi:hypothetical protein